MVGEEGSSKSHARQQADTKDSDATEKLGGACRSCDGSGCGSGGGAPGGCGWGRVRTGNMVLKNASHFGTGVSVRGGMGRGMQSSRKCG